MIPAELEKPVLKACFWILLCSPHSSLLVYFHDYLEIDLPLLYHFYGKNEAKLYDPNECLCAVSLIRLSLILVFSLLFNLQGQLILLDHKTL